MALAPCVKDILCGLSAAALNALNAAIASYRAQLEVQITALRAALLQFDVLVIPVRAAESAASQLLASAQAGLRIVPLQLIADCVDLGNFNLNLQQVIDGFTADVRTAAEELGRMLSYRDELELVIQEYENILEELTNIQLLIQECAG